MEMATKSDTMTMGRAETDNSECNESLPGPHASTSPASDQARKPLRRGKWSPEEERFALAAIRDFNRGYLDSVPGSTLRAYLSDKLRCDPMRITKKFTGEASIGKKVFHPAPRDDPTIRTEIEESQAKLVHLYEKYQNRIESQEQEMARKSMAAVAVADASTFCDSTGLHLFSTMPPSSHLHGHTAFNSLVRNDIAITATWLEKAEALLSSTTENSQVQKEIEDEMTQISRLIAGAPLSTDSNKVLDNPHTFAVPSSAHTLNSCPDLRILGASVGNGSCEPSAPTSTDGKRKHALSDDENICDPMKLLASISSQATPVRVDTNGDAERVDAGAQTREAKLFVEFLRELNT